MQSFQLYVPGDSFLYRLDPRIKLIVVAVVFLISVLFQDARYLAPIFCVVLVVALLGRVPLRRVGVLLKSLTLLVLTSMVLWPLIYHAGHVVIEIFGVGITDQGIWYGLGMAFRILDMVITPIVLFLTTTQSDFVTGLRRLGLPYRACFALMMSFRFLPTVAGVGQTIVEAQRARGLDPSSGGLLGRLRSYSRILGPLMVTSLRMAQQSILAVEARAFSVGRPRSSLRMLSFRTADRLALAGVCLVAALAVTARLRGLGTL